MSASELQCMNIILLVLVNISNHEEVIAACFRYKYIVLYIYGIITQDLYLNQSTLFIDLTQY